MAPGNRNHREPSEFEEKVVQVSRVSKKTKGGNKIGFSVLVVVGDKNGKVGVGLGKGPDVLSSIRKASRRAKKRMVRLPLVEGTIPFPVSIKRGAARLMLKPAPKGTGVIAGGSVRAVVEAAGVSNIVSKILGSSNQASNVYATFEALKKVRTIAEIKGIKLEAPAKKAEKSKDKPKQTKSANEKQTDKKSDKPKKETSKKNTTAKTKTKQTKKVAAKKEAKPASKASTKKTTKKTAKKS